MQWGKKRFTHKEPNCLDFKRKEWEEKTAFAWEQKWSHFYTDFYLEMWATHFHSKSSGRTEKWKHCIVPSSDRFESRNNEKALYCRDATCVTSTYSNTKVSFSVTGQWVSNSKRERERERERERKASITAGSAFKFLFSLLSRNYRGFCETTRRSSMVLSRKRFFSTF